MLDAFSFIQYAPKGEACEDAYCYDFSGTDANLIGVFDGCGGLGAKRYSKIKNRTGAFVAAQTAAKVTACLFSANHSSVNSTLLHDSILAELMKFENKYGEKSSLVGSMVKTLPTTAALITVSSGKQGHKRIVSLSAGDSRNYLLTSQYGLQQISADELQGNPDALENIFDSAPLSNVINIDTPFSIASRFLDVKEPFAVISATDGTFGYLRSPMDFEAAVLHSICQNDSMDAFQQAMLRIFSSAAGDDSTMIAAFYGWGTYTDLKNQLASRQKYIDEIICRLDHGVGYESIVNIWNEYNTNYFVKADVFHE